MRRSSPRSDASTGHSGRRLWPILIILAALTSGLLLGHFDYVKDAWAQVSSLANRKLEQLGITGGVLDTNVKQWNGVTVLAGSGVTGTGSPRVSIATNANVVDTELPDAVALADTTANPTVPATGAFMMAFTGTSWERVRAGLGDSPTGANYTGVINTVPFVVNAGATNVDRLTIPRGDAITAGIPGAAQTVFNGTNFDRARSMQAFSDSTGIGIPSAGLTGQLDDTATTTVTENNYAPIRISPRRALLVEGVASGTPVAVTLESATKTTYSAAVIGLAPAATATDIFEIAGSGTKTVKIRRLQISCTATAAGAYDFVLVKRSTANTVGTSTTLTNVSYDSNDAAATAVVKAYTANPTTGTLVGNVRSIKGTVTTSAGAIPNIPTTVDFGTRGNEAAVLRGTAQLYAINLNATTMTGGSCDADVEWTEE